MLIDAAKGVEPQTKKLFQVCRMRDIPIFTFVNKLDRYGRAPLDLMDELEQVLGIRAYPMNWPIGMGPEFRGVYDRAAREVHLFSSEGTHGEAEVGERSVAARLARASPRCSPRPSWRSSARTSSCSTSAATRSTARRATEGQITPMFFGSAMTNFGVRPFLDAFLELAPAPAAAQDRPRSPAADATTASAASSSRSRRTWTRRTATASPSSASSPAGTSRA